MNADAHIDALKDGMIAVALRADHSNFYNYGGGIINKDDDSDLCNTTAVDHAVVMVGYIDEGDYFVLKNSWGSGWGENGYFKVHKDCIMGFYSYRSSQAIF